MAVYEGDYIKKKTNKQTNKKKAPFKGKNPSKIGNYTIFFLRRSKILGEAGSKKFYNKCSENSRCQIVFRTDIFRKLTFGAPKSPNALLNNKLDFFLLPYFNIRQRHASYTVSCC